MKNKNKIFFSLILLTVTILANSCIPAIKFSNKSEQINQNVQQNLTVRGFASYYHDKFEGRTTANGEIFSQKLYTAAHRELPFGTLVRVTRLSNGKSVTVRINDRGPFVENRIIDLSYAAAMEIDLIGAGVAEVMLEILK